MEKFDGTNNFGIWQCEVSDVLCQQELEVAFEEKPDMMNDKEWIKINRHACGTIRLCLVKYQKYFVMRYWMRQCEVLDVLCQQELEVAFEEKHDMMNDNEWIKINRHVCGTIRLCLAKYQKYSVMRETSAKKLWETLEEKYMEKSLENRLYMKKKFYRFTYTPGMSMNDHVNSFNKILADLLNLDEKFEDKDKALLLLNSLPDEYDHLTTTLLHGKDNVIFDVVCSALYNPETRKKDRKDHRDTITEALTVRGRLQGRKLGKRSKFKGRPAKDECAFCREKGHWKKNCPKLQKGKATSDACVAEHDEESYFSLVVAKALTVRKGTRRNNLYYFQGSTVIGSASTVFGKNADSEATKLWHMRVGPIGEKTLQTLVKEDLLKCTNSCKLKFCEYCVLGKQTRVKLGSAIHDTKGILDYVHSDVWGLTKIVSLGGMHYFVTFIDDYSRKVWVYLMKNKNEVLGIFLKWKKMVETQTGRNVKRLRLDNGGEYKNDPFIQICQDEGIVPHFTIRDTLQQNEAAECMNRTILEKVRCMLSNAGLGKEFWAEVVVYTCHRINRLSSAAIEGKTPIEMWIGNPATDYNSLYVFGFSAYYHVKESKLDPRAKKALFMAMLKQKDSQEDDKTSSTLQQVEFEKVKYDPAGVDETNNDSPSTEDDEEVLTQEPSHPQDSIAYRRPQREIHRLARFVDMVAYALPIVDDDVPFTYRKAELVTLPKENKAIGCKWVYAKNNGFSRKNEIRYKARLVAKGYAQKEGIDYNDVFSPVVKHSSIRILLAMVEQFDLELVQLNVKTVFLHGDLEEEIYMTQPYGLKVAGKENWVCKLTKSLYGLKQSLRQWYKRFDRFMKGQRYTRNKFDHCVYFRKLQEGSFIYLLLYVDDMLIASKSKDEIEKLKTQLNQESEMKDISEAKKILGMEICRDRAHGKVNFSQKQYLKNVLQQFSMT
ncbi:Integrase catalytic domain-containing protein [Citrus sinensis]|uniref:Integrase catalytic domain-containing protein n=1 Tax=Citrus sinensis TaxID=2711 RepID=A0ACB8IMU8_CITSI|nr:Integrase catalytic domain-containing protein [Citrus sinensis]